MNDYAYPGGELELFASAVHWKAYCRDELAPYVRGDVLEVGAGQGATTRALSDGTARSWTCLEPDPQFAAQLPQALASCPGPTQYHVRTGTLADLAQDALFDTVLYIDVLEHIEHDAREVELAAAKLRAGGQLVVLSPAHDFLMSAFDRAIGHHRRYNRNTLAKLTPPQLEQVSARYLDSVGVLLSLGNRLAQRQTLPTPAQIRVWDQLVVPISRRADAWLAHRLGKSILMVWRKR